MFRLGVVYKDGEIKAYNFSTQDEAESFLLTESEKGIKIAKLRNQETKEETMLWKE